MEGDSELSEKLLGEWESIAQLYRYRRALFGNDERMNKAMSVSRGHGLLIIALMLDNALVAALCRVTDDRGGQRNRRVTLDLTGKKELVKKARKATQELRDIRNDYIAHRSANPKPPPKVPTSLDEAVTAVYRPLAKMVQESGGTHRRISSNPVEDKSGLGGIRNNEHHARFLRDHLEPMVEELQEDYEKGL